MQSPVKAFRRQDIETSKFEMPEFTMPKVDLSNLEMPKMDLSKVDLSKVDVGRAMSDAAIAVGLSKPRPSRWPFALGAILVVTAAGLALMNASMIQERVAQARRWIAAKMSEMRAGGLDDEPVAFTAAETKSIESPVWDTVPGSQPADYPEGLGASPESVTANGRSKVTSPS